MSPHDSSASQKLTHYVLTGNVEGVITALNAGAKVDGASKGLRTPLHLASLNGQLDIVKVLCQHRANLALRSLLDKGMQPLHLAAKNGHASVVQELIQRGADSNDTYYKGLQAMHTAAAQNKTAVLEVLNQHSCDVNAVSRDGNTPLHLAAEHACLEAALWLLSHGANVMAKNYDLLTPEDCARRRNNVEMVKLLFQKVQNVVGGEAPQEPTKPQRKPQTQPKKRQAPTPKPRNLTPPQDSPNKFEEGAARLPRNIDKSPTRLRTADKSPARLMTPTNQSPSRRVTEKSPTRRITDKMHIEKSPTRQTERRTRIDKSPARRLINNRMHVDKSPARQIITDRRTDHSPAGPIERTKNRETNCSPGEGLENLRERVETAAYKIETTDHKIKTEMHKMETAMHKLEEVQHKNPLSPGEARPKGGPQIVKPIRPTPGTKPKKLDEAPREVKPKNLDEAPREVKPKKLDEAHREVKPKKLDEAPREVKPKYEAQTPTKEAQNKQKLYNNLDMPPNETKPKQKPDARVDVREQGDYRGSGMGAEGGGAENKEVEEESGVLHRLLSAPERFEGGASSSSGGSDNFQSPNDPAEEELIDAVCSGQQDEVVRLLSEGVSTETRSTREGEKGLRPLHLAAWSGHQNVVRILLLHNPNRKAMAHGLAPVHWAAVGGHTSVLEVLWDEGFSIKSRAEDGATPLHLAADHDNLEAVTWLVEKGAFLGAKDKRGCTAKDLARQAGNKAISGYLKEKEDELRLENMTEKKKLGEGSFGDVYLVRNGSKQIVVKKINLSELTRRQQEYAHTELKILKKLAHPYIVAYKGGGFQGRFLHIHMEFCSGGDLAALIQRTKQKGRVFQETHVYNWVLRLCLALKYLHGRKVLHRDIKPHNIFLTDAGHIKLGDFGLVRVLGEASVMADTSLGTPAYMSPEVLQGVGYDAKADMWSLGCVFYELAALERGFPFTQVKVPGKFRREYKDLVLSLLERQPTNRPSATQVLCLPFLVGIAGNQLELREQEVTSLSREVQELSEELTEATKELDTLKTRRWASDE